MSFDQFQDSEHRGSPLLLFRFFSGERRWLYTNHRLPITSGTEVYGNIPISMGPTEQSAQELPQGVEINLPSSTPLAFEFKQFLPPQPIEVDVLTRHRDDPDGEYRPVFFGEAASAVFNEDGTATITCFPIGHKMQRVIPWPVYSPTCNWPVYSPGCGVNRELYRVDGTVNAIDRDVVSAAAFGTKEDQWFASGYVLRRETNEVRWIISHEGPNLTLVAPFVGLRSGEVLSAYAGCDGLESTCKDKFNNLPRHAGFPDVPRKNPFTENVFGTGNKGSGGGSDSGKAPWRSIGNLVE